jgi:hypothetical protein
MLNQVPMQDKNVLTPQVYAHLVSFLAKIIFKTYSIWASTAKGDKHCVNFLLKILGIL